MNFFRSFFLFDSNKIQRWKALKGAGATANTNVEYNAIIDMFAELSKDQKIYEARREELKSIETKGMLSLITFHAFIKFSSIYIVFCYLT